MGGVANDVTASRHVSPGRDRVPGFALAEGAEELGEGLFQQGKGHLRRHEQLHAGGTGHLGNADTDLPFVDLSCTERLG